MTTRNAIGAILGLGLVSSLVLAGCGSGGSGGTSSSTPAANSGSASTGGSTGSTGGTTTGGSSSASVAKADGNYVMLKVPFNEQVFGVSGQAGPTPAFDQGGNTLDPSDPVWPKSTGEVAVPNSKVKVWFAGTKGKTGLNFGPEAGGKATVPADGGKYKTMDVITGAGNGGSGNTVDVTFNYADGSKDTATFASDDWCSSSPTGAPAWVPADRWDANGSPTTPACGVFLVSVPIPGSSKQLKSIDLVNDSGNPANFEPNVLAITLEKA